MQQYPPNWEGAALAEANVPITQETVTVMRAWAKSTPLSPYANNPIGMPVGSSGAKAYAGTSYAAFPSMERFYAAFAVFRDSWQGNILHNVMLAESPYGPAWRAIHNLNWPGSQTETDYPSAILELTTKTYRDSVKSTPASERKTSGVIAAPSHAKAQVIEQARMLPNAVRALELGGRATANVLRRNRGNRLHVQDPVSGA